MPSGWHGRFLRAYIVGQITLSYALSCEGVLLLDNVLRPFVGVLTSEVIEWYVFSQFCS